MTAQIPSSRSTAGRTALAVFQLCRFPAVFSAWADILVGQGIAAGKIDFSKPSLYWLLVATTGLYFSGMIFNDVADRNVDLRERPGRPIPSGRISLNLAVGLGLALMSGGLIASACAGPKSVMIGLLIAIAAQGYNFILKGTLIGCLVMGLCRGLNVLLGASPEFGWPIVEQLPASFAIIYTFYIAGLTWFARQESAMTIHRQELLGGIYLTSLARILWALQLLTRPMSVTAGIAFVLLMTIWIRSVKRLVSISRKPTAPLVQQGVRSLLLVIIPQQALLLLGLSGDYIGALIVMLLIVPARRLSRYMAIT